MKKMVRMAAALAWVVMKRSMEMVQAIYTQSNEQAQVRYIGRRLNRGTVNASVVPQTRPQQAMPMLIFDLITPSVMSTISRRSLK